MVYLNQTHYFALGSAAYVLVSEKTSTCVGLLILLPKSIFPTCSFKPVLLRSWLALKYIGMTHAV